MAINQWPAAMGAADPAARYWLKVTGAIALFVASQAGWYFTQRMLESGAATAATQASITANTNMTQHNQQSAARNTQTLNRLVNLQTRISDNMAHMQKQIARAQTQIQQLPDGSTLDQRFGRVNDAVGNLRAAVTNLRQQQNTMQERFMRWMYNNRAGWGLAVPGARPPKD